MTYFLVMGGLALSASFTLGWALWRSLRWLLSRLPGSRSGKPRKTSKPARRSTRQAAKPARRPAQAAPHRKAAAQPASRSPRPPSRLTRWLAGWHAALPLGVVAGLSYLVARLAEYGLAFRPPHAAPP